MDTEGLNFEWPRSNHWISSFQEFLDLLHCIYHLEEDYVFECPLPLPDQIVGPLLRCGLSLVPGILWKVAVESVTCLEDTQTKQMWFVHKHNTCTDTCVPSSCCSFHLPDLKETRMRKRWISNILYLSKYNPFTLRYNLFNISILKVNYRKRLCEIHTMQYNCLDRFLWFQVWINVYTSLKFNKVGYFFPKERVLKHPLLTSLVIFKAIILY